MQHAEGEKLNFKLILPIFVIVLVDLLGLTIIIPLMALYAARFNADAFTIGVLGAMYPMMQFVGAPVLGRLSDRFGRKPVLLISQVGTFLGFLLLGFANTLWMLFLARIIDGLSGANISTAQAAITDSTTEKTRTQGLGLIGAAFGLGFVIGPVIAFASLAASGNDYRVPAFLAALFSAISIVLTTLWFHETLPKERRGLASQNARRAFSLVALLQALRTPQLGILLVLIFAQQIAFGGFEQFLTLFNLTRLGLNASGNAILFVFVGVILFIVQGGMVGKWSRRFGDRKLMLAGLAILAVGLILVALTPRQPLPGYSQAQLQEELSGAGSVRNFDHPTTTHLVMDLPPDEPNGWLGLAWILVAMLPTAIGGSILHPSINSLITQNTPADDVGGMLGISAAFLSAANAFAPLIMGIIFQWLGSSAPFLFGGILIAVLFLVAWKKIH